MGALSDIGIYLSQTLLSLYMVAMLLRFLMQWAKADFYNPISQFLVKVTNPLVIPLRRVVPGFGGFDLATLLLTLLLQIAAIVLVLLLNGYGLPNPLLLVVWATLGLLGLLVNIYFFAILAMVVLSWLASGNSNPAIGLLHQITEPVLKPFRKLLPPMGGFDFSVILVFVLINVIKIVLSHMAASVNLHSALVIGL
ncbi:MAG: YggT family protein [Halioglobus sp.]|jgi:YggT family protein